MSFNGLSRPMVCLLDWVDDRATVKIFKKSPGMSCAVDADPGVVTLISGSMRLV